MHPFPEFPPEEDAPTVEVSFTMNELAAILSQVAFDTIWDDHAVGYSIFRKGVAAIQALVNRDDPDIVQKLMKAPTKEPRRTRNKS